jgi:polysaccharide export outer membrane protein
MVEAGERRETLSRAMDRWRSTAESRAYRIGTGDVVEVDVYELEEPGRRTELALEVAPRGQIHVPLIGDVTAAGLTTAELRERIQGRLAAEYMVDPQVGVSVKEYNGRQVTVMGAVRKPGVYTLRRNAVTVLDAIARAGGLTEKAGRTISVTHAGSAEGGSPAALAASAEDASLESLTAEDAGIYDTDAEGAAGAAAQTDYEGDAAITIDVYGLIEQGRPELNVMVADGDVVNVLPADEFYVTGLVDKPGAYPLRRRTTVLEAVALAGGVDRRASPEGTQILRVADGRREIIGADLNRINEGKDENITIERQDIIRVQQTPSKRFWTKVEQTLYGVFDVSVGYHRPF